MNRILLDAKKLLLGIDETENEPADFKEEINNSIKNNTITKAMATLLLTARKNADALGKKIVKKQEDDVSGKGSRVSNKQVNKMIENESKEEKIKIEKKREEEKARRVEVCAQCRGFGSGWCDLRRHFDLCPAG